MELLACRRRRRHMMTICTALALSLLSLAGCALTPSPQDSGRLRPCPQTVSRVTPSPQACELEVAMLPGYGPFSVDIPALIAGHSVAELKAILHGLPVRFHDPDGWESHRERGRVFLSLSAGFCTTVTSARATLDSSGSVTIGYDSETDCANGAGAQAIPHLWLLSVGADRLPATVVSFHVTGESRARGSAAWAMIDMRRPLPTVDPATSASAAAIAVNAALTAIGSKPPHELAVLELDLMRWPDRSLSCGRPSAALPPQPVPGVVVVVNKAPFAAPKPNEFHWAAGTLVDCGAPAG
jgi:hypothetical protein